MASKDIIPYTHDLRNDIATLVEAREGKNLVELWTALVVAAVDVDRGELLDSLGRPGWAWNPDKYANHKDPVKARLSQAGASLGWLLYAGHSNRRTVAAFTEACYFVTMNQTDDVTARVERLWDLVDRETPAPTPPPPALRRGILRRVWDWLRDFVTPKYYE